MRKLPSPLLYNFTKKTTCFAGLLQLKAVVSQVGSNAALRYAKEISWRFQAWIKGLTHNKHCDFIYLKERARSSVGWFLPQRLTAAGSGSGLSQEPLQGLPYG